MTEPTQPLPDDLLNEIDVRYPHLYRLACVPDATYMMSVPVFVRTEMQTEAKAVLERLALAEGHVQRLQTEFEARIDVLERVLAELQRQGGCQRSRRPPGTL